MPTRDSDIDLLSDVEWLKCDTCHTGFSHVHFHNNVYTRVTEGGACPMTWALDGKCKGTLRRV